MAQYYNFFLYTCSSCFFINTKITYRNQQLNLKALSTFARTMKPAFFSKALKTGQSYTFRINIDYILVQYLIYSDGVI